MPLYFSDGKTAATSSWSDYAKVVSSIFLIAGTSVGGGMLALPVSGGRSGFLPSLTVMVGAWLFMTLTGLLYVEVSLWLKGEAHLISMAAKLLGRRGKALCWLVYLFIGYASLVAYLAEGGRMVGSFTSDLLAWDVGKLGGCLIYLSVFAGVLVMGSRILARFNSLLFCGMMISFGLLIAASASNLQPQLLLEQRWQGPEMVALFPLMLTTFSYPGLVPIVVATVQRRPKHARLAVIGGTSLTFTFYLIWLVVVLGSIPYEGGLGLKQAYEQDLAATHCLAALVQNPWITSLAQAFGFLALTTSFVGVAWGLFEFLADGLQMRPQGWRKPWLGALVMGPALLLTLGFEKVFFVALEISGGIGDALISGLVPAAMVWAGCYQQRYKTSASFLGHKRFLVGIGGVAASVLIYELGRRLLSF